MPPQLTYTATHVCTGDVVDILERHLVRRECLPERPDANFIPGVPAPFPFGTLLAISWKVGLGQLGTPPTLYTRDDVAPQLGHAHNSLSSHSHPTDTTALNRLAGVTAAEAFARFRNVRDEVRKAQGGKPVKRLRTADA